MSSNFDETTISFDMPKNQSNVIKVIGVGGGGSNAINHMFNQGIKGVDFVICNTDAQALENSSVPIKIQLGVSLTEGLGAGANPAIGEQSAMESLEEIKNMLSTNTKMIFITAGMGGGTGTGAAPIIAKMAKELDILTVGIVTIPFQFEGKMRGEQAQIGVEKLRVNCDSLVVINNNKLREVYGNLGFKAGFSKADEVLATAARGIAEVITHHYTQNIDLRDAKTVLANSGTAIMGSASASGANRAQDAISKALDSPLLNDNKIKGAKNVLLLIVSGNEEITIDEIGEISDHIQDEAGHSANIIMGIGEDESLEGAVAITVIATGFNAEQQDDISNTETKKIIHTLEEEQKAQQDLSVKPGMAPIEIPKTEEPPAPKPNPVIRHTLVFDEEEPVAKKPSNTFVAEENQQTASQASLPFEGYIETSELIKNIDVESTVVHSYDREQFQQQLIHNIDVNSFEIVTPKAERNESETISEKEDRFTIVEKKEKPPVPETETEEQMLMFDLPLNKTEPRKMEPKKQESDEVMTSNIEDIDVNDALEVIPITEVSDKGVKRYSLDDYEEKENELLNAKPAPKNKASEEDIAFETKTVAPKPEEEVAPEDVDPMNTPISKLLASRTEERKKTMKEFNYKFRNNASKIDEIEKQPAYKRMGIELEDKKTDTNLSRTSVNTDDDGVDLRNNNSFLHDNVD
jgi:cell division protein FtsZ